MTRWIDIFARAVAIIILVQTLFFKFSAAPESVFIFTALGVEPWGRIFSGIVELIVCVLLIIPGATAFGALLGAGTMLGALGAHFVKLGVVVQADGGLLFSLALVTLACCLYTVWYHRLTLMALLKRN
jgi:putative oxidoreductase